MPVVLKSPAEIKRMRKAGLVAANVHAALRERVAPGVTTAELDELARELIERAGARSSFLGYHGYPATICTSVNEEILHGIPGPRRLEEGDIVSIDVGVFLDGYHADTAVTLPVGDVSDEALALIDATEASFWAGFEQVRPGNRIGDVAAAVQALAEARGFSVVRDYAGHGVGRRMHEEPSVPNVGEPGTGLLLRPGMTFALEPMLCAGSAETRVLADGWTVVTKDGLLAAHYEHTVAVTEEGALVLTRGGLDVL